MPGLQFPASGDPGVTYDPVRGVFLYAFVEFTRNDDSKGRIGVEASSDGVNWSRNTTLDSSNATDGVDKPSITVDQNPSSPHFGRVLVAWTEFTGNNAVFQADHTDNGGASWQGSSTSVNNTNHECGNGTSPAFNANGEAMIAWAGCNSGNQVLEALSADGGTTWNTDVTVTSTSPLAGAEDPNAADCLLDRGGSAFRCNSFPTLAGDPNSADAGGTAFVVVWADVRSTTQNSQTANVSQLIGLSTVNDGTAWNGGANFSFDFMAFNDFGDKFFPAASFSPSGRLTVSYSSREDDASSGNPNGKKFNEHQTEASSLTALRSNSFTSYTTDSTLGDPGSLSFIGDYSGNSSLDESFDTFPIWTDLRSGFPSIRTQDLCYSDCFGFLPPGSPLSVGHTTGTSFTDFWRLSMDASTGGSGGNFWNVVAIRPGTDGSSIDDDMFLSPNRYYNSSLANSSFGTPLLDYLLINGNAGHAPDTVYFPQVHSFSSVGGSYSVQWDPGHVVLSTAFTDSMGSADVARVYDTFDSTATNYFFGLRPSSGNTSIYSLDVHSASGAPEQGRPQATAGSTSSSPGQPTFIQRNTGASPTAFDGVVALNDNSGSGGYTLYRDTQAPTGTIKIDGGAKATNSTTLSLTLNATNPTAGDPVADMAFSVNGGAFTAFQHYSTSATVSVPTGDGPKTVVVRYRNGAGATTDVSGSIYLIQHPPTVTSLSPNNGAPAGGNTITITGTNFAPGATVKFGANASSVVTFVSATQIKAKVPAAAVGKVHVTVTTADATSTTTSADLYAYGLPTITSVVPDGGPTGGGNTVTINGTNFTSTTTVRFASTASTAVTFVSSTQVKAKAPAHAAGSVPVHVQNAAGLSATSNADLYAYGAPTITSLSPASGPAGGGNNVTINGSGFAPGATVKFGTTAASTVTFVSDTQLKAKAPTHSAGTVHVSVHTPGGTSAQTIHDEYAFGAPTVTSLSPASGPAAGGNTVTIHGTGFAPGATVNFAATSSSSVTFVSGTQIKAKAPAHGATTVHVSVHTAAGTSPASSADQYAYTP
jgi:hypothetical protein